jgi:hypothetical protein
MRKLMLKHPLLLRDISHWAIFITAAIALATSIADVSAKQTMEIIMLYPELAENSMLVKVGYLPSFK